jgi:molybdopterin molybdotransferase
MSFISYEESQEALSQLHVGAVKTEKVFLGNALGRILAEDIIADEDYPKQPTAAMDGYAVRYSDFAAGRIEIAGNNPAGSDNICAVYEGVCVKTFTGAAMPEGADTLIQIENVHVEDGSIVIDEEVPFASNVRPVGESYFKGDVLIAKGVRIGFAEIGVMAGLNRVMIPVVLKPKVAVIATGSEVLDLGEKAQNNAQIRSTNNYTIAAIAESAGAQVVQLGTTKDDRTSIMQTFENALESSDIVVSTGGVSVGDYDFVKEVVPALGATVIYKGVRIKPGQHIMIAQRGSKFILALPGFAYSSTVTFILYALPLIRRMLGREECEEPIEATLREPFIKRSKKSEFTACNLSFEDGKYYVDFEGKKTGTSAILTNMLGNTALMLTGEDDGSLEAGTTVRVIKLERF